MTRTYWGAALSTILWKTLKAAIGVALIFVALYSFVWITGTFLSLDPAASAILTSHQALTLGLTLSGIYCFLVLIGKI